MSFGLGMQIFGLTVAICAMVAIIVTASIKQIIAHYFAAKSAYAQCLKDMATTDGFKDMLEALAKRRQDGLVGKDL